MSAWPADRETIKEWSEAGYHNAHARTEEWSLTRSLCVNIRSGEELAIADWAPGRPSGEWAASFHGPKRSGKERDYRPRKDFLGMMRETLSPDDATTITNALSDPERVLSSLEGVLQ